MGFRNTDEVKHKFKRACTTTAHRKMGGGWESEGCREARESAERHLMESLYIDPGNFNLFIFIYFMRNYTHFPNNGCTKHSVRI